MTPEQRRQRAKIAANARWSRHMAREDHAAVMRDVMRARLEREVDPDGTLPAAEREARGVSGEAVGGGTQRSEGPEAGHA